MKNVMLTLIALAVLETSLLAGTKQDGTVIVRNASNQTAAVIIDPPAGLPANPTLQQFQAAGGKILNPGAGTTFRVRAGQHVMVAQLVDITTGQQIGAQFQQNITVNRNQTLRFRVEGTNNANVVPD